MIDTRSARIGFRPDIQGLRAVAVTLVVLYHAGLPWLSGGYVGVDVFFVISGFLITSLIAREIDRAGRVDFRAFYARRIRRLLPSAGLVLVVTMVAAKVMLPPLALVRISSNALATAVYGSNIWLALDGTDYLANEGPSPLQHYWSLAVEEQFYLLWPVFLVLIFGLARGRWPVVAWVSGLVAVLSLVACVVLTTVQQPWAFFSLPTRAWELGVGGLLALAMRRRSGPPPALARVLGWAGLGLVAAAALLFTDATAFPGWAAAVPVLGSAAVLAAGHRRLRGSADLVLVPRPMQQLGRLSYTLYLWHWPVLLIPAAVYGDLHWPVRAGLVALAVVLAWLTSQFVEDPVRRSAWVRARRRRSFVLAAAVTAVAVAVAGLSGVMPKLSTDVQVPPLTASAAAASVPAPTVVPANVAPPLTSVSDDYPVIYDDGCHGGLPDVSPGECVFGVAGAARKVFLAGDSHAGQWFPALQRMATEDGWRLVSVTKSSCPTVDFTVRNTALRRDYTECDAWLDAVVHRIEVERPDVVVLGNWSGSYVSELGSGGTTRWVEGLRGFIQRLPAHTHVVVLGDGPTWASPPVNCLSDHLRSPESCARPVQELIDADLDAQEATLAGPDVSYVPTYTWLCGDVCQALDRNVVMYRDYHHVSATMSGLLVDRFRQVVVAAALPAH